MRRLLAAAGAAALGLAIVVPIARAAMPDDNDKLQFWAPTYDRQTGNRCDSFSPPKCPPSTAPDGAVVYSTDEVVTARADFVDGVKSWDVRLVPASGGAPSTCHEDIDKQSGSYPTTVYITCPWDTTRAVDRTLNQPTPAGVAGDPNFQRNWHLNDHGPSVNGKYTVEVTVANAGRPQGLITPSIPPDQFTLYEDPNANPPRWRQIWVNNGVADPTGVNSAFDAATNRINVTWAANPEPDVSYLVQEKVGDGKWSGGVAVPGSATNYVRAIDQPGKYQYQVAAVRPAPTADSGKGASATKTSNYVAAQAVEIAQVTPPTTGPNGPDGTIDHSGDNGVFLPTDPTSSTAPGSHASGPGKGSSAAGRSTGGASGARPGPVGSSSRPTGASAPAGGDAAGEGADTGFSATLPFQAKNNGSVDGLGGGDETPQSMSKLVNVPRPTDTRALLIPLAEGLALFVFAMQVTVVMRRRPATVATPKDDFDDWMGF